MIIPLLSGEKEPRLLVCSPLHHRLSKKDGIWSHKRISRCPSFSQRAPSVSGALAAGGGCGRTAEAKGVPSHSPGIVTGAPKAYRTLAWGLYTEPSGAPTASGKQRLASSGPARATHQEAPSHQSCWGQNRTSTAGVSCTAETGRGRGEEAAFSHQIKSQTWTLCLSRQVFIFLS